MKKIGQFIVKRSIFLFGLKICESITMGKLPQEMAVLLANLTALYKEVGKLISNIRANQKYI